MFAGLDPKLEKTEIGPEAGPVQEGLVEKAQAKRARERVEKTNEAKQKRGNAELVWKKDDTELGKEEEVEEEQEVSALHFHLQCTFCSNFGWRFSQWQISSDDDCLRLVTRQSASENCLIFFM